MKEVRCSIHGVQYDTAAECPYCAANDDGLAKTRSSLSADREKELHSQIEDLRSQLEREYERNQALHKQINFYYSLMEIYRSAVEDIIFCKVPDMPRGATVSAEKLGVYAMDRTHQAETEAQGVVIEG